MSIFLRSLKLHSTIRAYERFKEPRNIYMADTIKEGVRQIKPLYDVFSKKGHYQFYYEMSVEGFLLNRLMEKHGISPSVIQAKNAPVDWFLAGFPETPVDVVRLISDKLHRETVFIQDLRNHWLEVADTLEKAYVVFHVNAESPDRYEMDPLLDCEDEDDVFEEPEDEFLHVGTWLYRLHNSQNDIQWIEKDGKNGFRSISPVGHIPAKETWQIEYSGNVIQVLQGTIDPNDFPCLKQAGDSKYRLEPDLPSQYCFTAADGLEITFLFDLFLEQYKKLFALIACISDAAYKDDVSGAKAESDLLRLLPYGTNDLRVVSECKDTAAYVINDFLFFTLELKNGFRAAFQEAADKMIRKKNGKLSTTRVWTFDMKARKITGKCPVFFAVDCKPVSENEADLRLFYGAKTPDGERNTKRL